MKRRKKNPVLVKTLRVLGKTVKTSRSRLWKNVAKRLEAPKKARARVNLSRINRYTEKGDTVVVPGKVLGAGALDHKVNVAALGFTREAKKRIEASGGQCISIATLVEKNPRGLKVKLIG